MKSSTANLLLTNSKNDYTLFYCLLTVFVRHKLPYRNQEGLNFYAFISFFTCPLLFSLFFYQRRVQIKKNDVRSVVWSRNRRKKSIVSRRHALRAAICSRSTRSSSPPKDSERALWSQLRSMELCQLRVNRLSPRRSAAEEHYAQFAFERELLLEPVCRFGKITRFDLVALERRASSVQ